jgi:glycosyltransferase involved in cell wall biosynthesis
MASGRLILAHAFPTIREVLEHNKDAISCEPGNMASLKEGFNLVLQNYGNLSLGHNARKKAFHKYTWENRAKEFLTFINNLILS